ncbi:phosphonate metabolism protein/1,5-bisphosphokinase (PRPP-forming) PhnN [Pseudomonas daroniae]|uniref:Ribose 1,5-bisphosphate phosphokinase PhnN n=1 Tax=Phytopseudomonas daroniae TaxID=2487519 RepID=A0A4Q9QS80_9GAMM|nr:MULTISPECIES: phosphonate metabolism protein/1,5-bisphosphokinase (PRPP-forming) PhnN [Pseudomonas]TBU83400.1 phosphonate metabolism protein/1,5-bisphosphokinase (PRPP-forming) PhnN [Pseudomonas daroniae]TBU85039.1 phosphonate metabolism protein/1,5-bisphosphokinase (PRPP-forming) PhnN [Pseudomonas sp. FRB 228]TBU93668.1 phosphonate metabolism protein/1,5-bisphosphokinase (PRPP-forming) PhnN [Pseudomonas daroniae]
MAGRLIYLMGPSGSGKDSLLDAARERLEAQGCRVARRVITRSAEAMGEDAIAVSCEEFEKRLLSGAFAMSWRANGLAYGIPGETDAWLAAGWQVLVNGSRGYLGEARQRYPDLLPILLEVSQDVLRSRLLCRGREALDEIEARLARNAKFVADGEGVAEHGVIRLDNSGPLEDTVTRLLQLVKAPTGFAD